MESSVLILFFQMPVHRRDRSYWTLLGEVTTGERKVVTMRNIAKKQEDDLLVAFALLEEKKDSSKSLLVKVSFELLLLFESLTEKKQTFDGFSLRYLSLCEKTELGQEYTDEIDSVYLEPRNEVVFFLLFFLYFCST